MNSERLRRLGALSILGLAASFAGLARQPLTFEERVKAQEAIERVYYSHRIWPKENPQPKPPFEKIVPKAEIEAKVTDYLKKCAALDKYWQRPIRPEQLQAEMDRIAQETRNPEILKEIFDRLDSDPYLIAECLARPVLADRLIDNWYASDTKLHAETRMRAETALRTTDPSQWATCAGGHYEKITFTPEETDQSVRNKLGNGLSPAIPIPAEQFLTRMKESLDPGALSSVQETHEAFTITHTLQKTPDMLKVEVLSFSKRPLREWLQRALPDNEAARDDADTDHQYTLNPKNPAAICEGAWSLGMLYPGPEARWGHAAVWTGSEMIIWGGGNTGGRYNPATDSWAPTSNGANVPAGRTSLTAIWTGSEMIVWGGSGSSFLLNSGGRYNPVNDSWLPTSTSTNVPAAREWHTAVWTGQEMIVWGGTTSTGYPLQPRNDGGRYDPSTDSWRPTSTGSNVPTARFSHTAVWTGSEMIVWGGDCFSSGLTNEGGRYNPYSDSWTSTPTATNCPSARSSHTAVWTGTEMIVWGGNDYSLVDLSTGGRYNPAANSWATTSTGIGLPLARRSHTAIWTGFEMIIWGGYSKDFYYNYLNAGGCYDPVRDFWRPTSTGSNAPTARTYHTAVWTGAEMIIWGGASSDAGGSNFLPQDGGSRYDPKTDTWVPTRCFPNVPSARANHAAIWTGTEMIVWGGGTDTTEWCTNTGGRYYPATSSWTPTSTEGDCPSARSAPTAVWTGTEMIVWGGDNPPSYFSSGGRYNPSSDTWTATSTGASCPLARDGHSAIWTGTEMIIWGGFFYDSSSHYFNTGGRYNPLSDTWTSTSTGTGLPEGRGWHNVVWTGTAMIIWGGEVSKPAYVANTGGQYFPATNSWIPTSTGGNVPAPREAAAAVWTGSEMVVWGGESWNPYQALNSGGRYRPSTDSWEPTSTGTTCPPSHSHHTAIWTGTEMIIWGGYSAPTQVNSGARYNPLLDTWIATSMGTNLPSGRDGHSAIWTGEDMIVWGGAQAGDFTSTGASYSPSPTVSGQATGCVAQGVVLSTQHFSGYRWNLNGAPILDAVSQTYTATQTGSYSVTVTDSHGCVETSAPHALTITPCAPIVQFDDTFYPSQSLVEICGNNNAIVEPGEKWQLAVRLMNSGDQGATGTMATLAVNQASAVTAIVANNPGGFGAIGAGDTATATYQFVVNPGAACVHDLTFDIIGITSSEGTYPSQISAFSVPVGYYQQGAATTQQTSPLNATSSTGSSNLGPAFTLASVTTATLSYAHAYVPPSPTVTLFSDEFAIAPVSNGWTVSGSVTSSGLSPTDTCAGGGGTYAKLTGASPSMARAISTAGRTNVALALDYSYTFMSSGQGIVVEYSTSGIAGPWTTQWSKLSTGMLQSANWSGDCGRTVVFPPSCENNPNFALRIRGIGSTLTSVMVDHLKVTADNPPADWTSSAKVELVDPSNAVTVLKAYGAADGNPYNVQPYYTGPGTYQIRLSESAGGTATVTSGSLAVTRTVVQCDVSSCSGPSGPPPVGNGKTGTTPATFTKNASNPQQVDVTYDATHCVGERTVILYGTIGSYSGYTGCAQTNAGNTGSAAIDTTSLNNVWFNIVWASGPTAGNPGNGYNGTADVPRTWTAAGRCGLTQDDGSKATCP